MADQARPPDRHVDLVIELYKRDIDRTLVRQQLRRTVDERVQTMIGALAFAEELRKARKVDQS